MSGARGRWLGLVLAACAPDTAPTPRPPGAPLPISGGTLLALDPDTVVAADPSGDRLWVVDVGDGLALRRVIDLPPGARPGRMVEADGEVWVVLRGLGSLARVDVIRGLLTEVPVCPDPRGLDRDPADGSLRVACADGDLVTVDALGRETARHRLDPDLRDVVIRGAHTWVSRFRSAEVLVVDPDGAVMERHLPPVHPGHLDAAAFTPSVAWRMVADPWGGGVLLSHQRAQPGLINLDDAMAFGLPAYGGDGCDAVVQSGLTRLFTDGREAETVGPLKKSVLPVDVIARDDGGAVLIAAGAGGLSDVAAATVDPGGPWGQFDTCTMLPGLSWSGIGGIQGGGRVVAAADAAAGLVLLTEAPLMLALAPGGGVTDSLLLQEGPPDRGVELFHVAPTGSVACASCHPEGGEDGRTWRFLRGGAEQPRRTQSLAGGVASATAPLHWDGEFADLPALLHDTFERRIGGTLLDGDAAAVEGLLHHVPSAPRMPSDPALVDRGQAVFREAGCEVCHGGPWRTDHQAHDVGTVDPDGGPLSLQTPSLIGLGARGPWMHDGCADTLEERFDPACGGADHGAVADADRAAVIAWLLSQ